MYFNIQNGQGWSIIHNCIFWIWIMVPSQKVHHRRLLGF